MPEAQALMIRSQDLSKRFGSFTAVRDLNLKVMPGEIFGFLGANGAGKTTAIRMLCGLIHPSGGEASVAGFDIFHQSEDLKRNIGYMSQRFSLYDDLSIGENISFYGGIYGLKTQFAVQRGEKLLQTFGMETALRTLTKSLPLGYKQRLALACALLHDPPLLFLDEPTSGVDPKARRSFWQQINQLADSGKTIIITTHFMDEAEYCHRVIVMSAGTVIAEGKPDELKKKHGMRSMQDLFLDLVGKNE